MKFITLTTALFATLATVSGQGTIIIGNPPEGASLAPGSEFTVQLIKKSISGTLYSAEMGIAIGVRTCSPDLDPSCPYPISSLGTVLYVGQYTPDFFGPGPPYQNFTLTVPDTVPAGNASLGVTRAYLIHRGASTHLDSASVDINISG